MRVYLVRHGQTAWNAERRFQGHTDIPLDEEGLEQARLFAASFEDHSASRILCSDLQRAKMTAEPLAQRLSLPVVIREDLRERCIGDWEAMPLEDVEARYRQAEHSSGLPREEVRPPNGESLVDSWNRIEQAATEIESFSGTQVVIVHGGTGGMLLARLIRATVSSSRSFRFDNTGVTTIQRRTDGVVQILRYNDSSHLNGLGGRAG